MSKEELKKALEALDFWATCFDHANFVSKHALYGGEIGCRKANDLLEEFIDGVIEAEKVG